jgi:magnesium transporter
MRRHAHNCSHTHPSYQTLRELYNYVLSAIATKPTHLKTGSVITREPTSEPTISRSSARQASIRRGSSRSHGSRELSDRSQGSLGTTIEELDDSEDEDETETNRDPNDDLEQLRDFPLNDSPQPDEMRSPADRRSVTFQRAQKASMGNLSERTVSGPPPWAQQITYRERLGGYLHPRDMRRLVTPFSGSNEPELIVRRHVMLLNFDPLRAIVLRDRLLILVPDGADSILETLAKKIKGGQDEMEASVFGEEHNSNPFDNSTVAHDHSPLEKSKEAAAAIADVIEEMEDNAANNKANDLPLKAPATSMRGSKKEFSKSSRKKRLTTIANFERAFSDDEGDSDDEGTAPFSSFEDDEWDDLKGKGWIDLPFELQSVDAVLHTVSVMLTDEANELQEFAYGEIDQLLGSKNSIAAEHGHDILRTVKGDISEMSGRCQGFIRAINVVLDDDEDLALMNLSRLITHPERFIQPVSEEILHEESDEPELILEAYLQQSISNTNALDLLRNQVTTTEELMNMKLDSVRNRLLYINTVVSLLTLAVGIGSFIGSIFGMNLYNGIEEDPNAFRQVVLGTCFGALGLLCILVFLFSRAGTLKLE